MKQILIFLVTVLTLNVFAQDPVIRISHNDLERDYKILFSAPVEQAVKINLLSSTHDILMSEEFNQKAFLKVYSLDKLKEGKYTWSIEYGNQVYTEDFRIKSAKQLMKESISVIMNDLNLDIYVKNYNHKPMNIFIFNAFGDQMDYVFWEPKEEEPKKKIDLSRYDAYEIKLEIVQGGDLAFEEEFLLY